jgi:hypothetical protein
MFMDEIRKKKTIQLRKWFKTKKISIIRMKIKFNNKKKS